MADDRNDISVESASPRREGNGRALVPYSFRSDSPDMVDLALGLWKGRWWFCAIFLLCLLAGILIGLFAPVHYSYTAVVQGGTLTALDEHKPFATGQALAARLQQIDIPRTLAAAVDKGNETARHVHVSATVEQDTQFVTLSALARAANGPQVTKLLEEIAQSASAGINKKIHRYVENQRSYLNNQIAVTQATIGRLEKQAEDLGHSGGEGASAATLVAVEISRLSDLVANYRQQLDVELPSGVEEAGLVSDVTRSAKPVSPGPLVWTGVGAVCGLVLGLFAAAFARLVVEVRRRLSIPA